MSSSRNPTLILAALIVTAGAAAPARGQSSDPPNNAPFQAGPLVFAPVIRLTNVGHDSNVFNRNDDDHPQGDVTATLSPAVDAWLRMAHGRANGRSQFDLYYFKTLTDLRAVDSDSSAHIETPVSRVMPYATGTFTNTRHRQNLEIDALARRRNATAIVGMDVKLTAKATAGLFTKRSNLEYEANSLYLNADLSRVLNHKSTGEGVGLRYALTPLTTIGIGAERTRDRFEFASERNSDNVGVNSNITFSPRALISGSVLVGIQKHRVLGGGAPDFRGMVMATDLTYTLLGRTRFTVAARRQLEYSFIDETDYVIGGVTLFATQRLGNSWDVGGSVGRDRLVYRRNPSSTNIAAIPDDTVLSSSGDVGYNLGHTQIGIHVEYRERQTDKLAAFRGYQRLRIGSTVTYAF